MTRETRWLACTLCLAFLVVAACAHSQQGPRVASHAPETVPAVAVVLGAAIPEHAVTPPDSVIESWKSQGLDVEARRAEYRGDAIAAAIWQPLAEKFRAEHNAYPSEEAIERLRTMLVMILRDDTEYEAARTRLFTATWSMREESSSGEMTIARRAELQAAIDQAERDLAEATPEIPRRAEAEQRAGDIKLQSALYAAYGGRASKRQVLPEASDAMHLYLKACEARGDFEVFDESDAKFFWAHFPGPGDSIEEEVENPAAEFKSLDEFLDAVPSANQRSGT